jgi:hypothetical protein
LFLDYFLKNINKTRSKLGYNIDLIVENSKRCRLFFTIHVLTLLYFTMDLLFNFLFILILNFLRYYILFELN